MTLNIPTEVRNLAREHYKLHHERARVTDKITRTLPSREPEYAYVCKVKGPRSKPYTVYTVVNIEHDSLNEPDVSELYVSELFHAEIKEDAVDAWVHEYDAKKEVKMKAYFVEGSDPDRGCDIVWAENASKAKSQARTCNCCADDQWIDIRVNRAKQLDDMEDRVPHGGSAWNSDELRVILVRDYNWSCMDICKPKEKEECPAKKWCHYYSE